MFLIRELVHTEKTYVSSLKKFMEIFVLPLKKILNSNQMTNLFSNSKKKNEKLKKFLIIFFF